MTDIFEILEHKREGSLRQWFAVSLGAHLLVIVLLGCGLTFPVTPHARKQIAMCEFILQSHAEPAKTPAKKIALNDSQAHGRRQKHAISKAEGTPENRHGVKPHHLSFRPLLPRVFRRIMPHKTLAMKTPTPRHVAPPVQRRLAVRPHLLPGAPQAPPQPIAVAAPREPIARAAVVPPQPVVAAAPVEPVAQAIAPPQPVQPGPALPETASDMGSPLNADKDIDDRDVSFHTKRSPDFGPYMRELHRRLTHSWHPPSQHGGRCVRVAFKIFRNGGIAALHVTRSCGNPEFDRAAVEAVQDASPFSPLPTGAPSYVDIDYTFDYHVIRH